MILNLLMRIDGKLTGQFSKIQKIKDKLKELESVIKEKGKSTTNPTTEDTSAIVTLTPVEQAAESPAFQLEGTEILGSFDDISPPHDEPQPEQPSPPNFEEVSIMDIFHRMVKEEQAEKEVAKAKAQKPTSVKAFPESMQTIRQTDQSGKDKGKATAPTQKKPKPPGKGRKTMATKTKFLKRRKFSKIAEKAKPSTISSTQDPLQILDQYSTEASPKSPSPQPSLEPLNVYFGTNKSTSFASSEID
ncbi:PREDICTED: uncharacterized protein LOC108661398 [Theobroma cacao]|uniref:Uncharacterized protein LOC108661398 n=1 Tax=Theobroma cacao TaxID=3641 RepID=A0AB32W0B0_THECC|nr:PREDICTED: uncharacterized protein LOC108661398 [Theobroma cacao]